MIYNAQDYWVVVLRPSPSILKNTEKYKNRSCNCNAPNRIGVSHPFTWQQKEIQLLKCVLYCSLEYRKMDKVEKFSNPNFLTCFHFRILYTFIVFSLLARCPALGNFLLNFTILTIPICVGVVLVKYVNKRGSWFLCKCVSWGVPLREERALI